MQGQVPLADQLTGRSREGYTCNIRPVAHNDIKGTGADTQMTWLGDCAYVSTTNGNGVAVIDVRDPKHPRLVTQLREPEWKGKGGALGIHEGLTANAQRHILVVPLAETLTTFDLTDCRHPKRLSYFEFALPDDLIKQQTGFDFGIHSGKLSPDGTLYYATDIGNGALSLSGPCLTVIDLRNLRKPSLYTRWGQSSPCHDLTLSPDGKRAYVGTYDAPVGYTFAEAGAFAPLSPLSHATSGLQILDVSQLQAHRPAPQVTAISKLSGGRQHTEVLARVKGRTYIVSGEEAFCPGGNGRLIDITDERHPVEVAELPLAINQPASCATNRADTTNALLLYMSHYISVDDPMDAHLAFFTWYGSGLRVFDISDPHHPREVAYLNPAVGADAPDTHDSSTTYPRYLPESGQIWFGAGVTGFNVVELAPSLRPHGSKRWSVPPQRPLPATFTYRGTTSDSLLLKESSSWWCTARL